jgi:hypothetical protein
LIEIILTFFLFSSPPLGAIIQQCLLESNNLFAEMFLRHLGKWKGAVFNQTTSSSSPSSVAQGIQVLRYVLSNFGLFQLTNTPTHTNTHTHSLFFIVFFSFIFFLNYEKRRKRQKRNEISF